MLCIFDLDGTLVDTTEDIAFSVNLVLKKLGLPQLSREQIAAQIGQGANWLLRRSLELAGADGESLLPKARELFLPIYSENLLRTTKLYPDALPALQSLKRAGHTLSLCTNKPESLTKKMIESLNMSHFFSLILGGDTLKSRKPDPEPLLFSMSKLGFSKTETAMIGDSIYDLQAGQSAGVKTFIVDRTGESPLPADYRCQSLKECAEIILSQAK